MDEIKNSDREGLAARVNALRLAEQSLREKNADAIGAIRRISRSLRFADGAFQHPEVTSIATILEETSPAELGNALEKYIPRLRSIASTMPARRQAVLLVEDDPLVRDVIQQRLGAPNRDLYAAKTIAEAEAALADHEMSLILLDLKLPDGDGRDFLTRLRERSSAAAIPVFIVSGRCESAVVTECFALGADAFFEKPVDPLVIATAVASRLQRSADLTQQASADPLTGLPNRSAFANAFHRATRLASRARENLAVGMLDVDRFKSVNDIYGHEMGDRVLKRLAAVVSKSLRASDLLARWGGEEFAVFFPNTEVDEARLAITKALKAFREEKFTTKDGRVLQVTFSAGVARVKSGATVEQAIDDADRYLYLAKAAGRDQVLTEEDKVTDIKRCVLLVEDDELTASVVKHYLKRDGFKVIHAKDAQGAIAATKDNPISLITLDVKIPGMDGFELLQRFRKVPSLHQVPVVMLTSAGRQEDIVRGFQLGADDYILKPFSPRELLARVHRFLQKQ